jgi:hypothetical protein
MSCSGLHCAGCAGGMALPVVPLAELYGLVWVTEHLAEVAAVSAACGALAVAAVVVLMRWCDRRQARQAAAHPLWIAREVPSVTASAERVQLGGEERQALGFRDLHIHLDGATNVTGQAFYLWLIRAGFPVGYQALCVVMQRQQGCRDPLPARSPAKPEPHEM